MERRRVARRRKHERKTKKPSESKHYTYLSQYSDEMHQQYIEPFQNKLYLSKITRMLRLAIKSNIVLKRYIQMMKVI